MSGERKKKGLKDKLVERALIRSDRIYIAILTPMRTLSSWSPSLMPLPIKRCHGDVGFFMPQYGQTVSSPLISLLQFGQSKDRRWFWVMFILLDFVKVANLYTLFLYYLVLFSNLPFTDAAATPLYNGKLGKQVT